MRLFLIIQGTIGSVLVGNSGRAHLANEDPDIGDRDASLVNKNDVCRSGLERFENDRAIATCNNIDDVWIPNQHGFERPLKQERRAGAERESNRLVRSPACGNRGQEHAQRKGETARTKPYGHRRSPDLFDYPLPDWAYRMAAAMQLLPCYTNLAANVGMGYGVEWLEANERMDSANLTHNPISKIHRDPTSAPGVASALPIDLVRALGWLRGHLSEPIQLEQLAQIGGVRPRTLETHFKMFLGTTPFGWVRRMRLARARQEMLYAAPEDTVTGVALSNGFSQLGRFAADYRKAFGELPSTTMQRARSSLENGTDMDIDEAIRLTLGALPFAFAVAPKQCSIALEELGRPQELAPTYGLPKAITAWCWGQRAAHRFSATPELDRERSCHFAKEAYDLAPNDALTLTLSSGALVLAHRLEEADLQLERALALDPWLAYAWVRRGWMSAYFGDSDAAIRELSIALHLMPFEPLRHLSFIGMGCAHFAAGRYDRAALWVQSGVRASPGSFWAQRIAVAAAALTGERGEARHLGRQLMRKDPDLTIVEARKAWPFSPAFMSRLGDGLEIAGLPRA